MVSDATRQDSPLVVAVVLTWNDVEMAAGCVHSLLQGDYANLRIVVVDNGSVEPCGQRVRERFPPVELVELPANRGFTGGSNAGLRHGVESGADYVILFNNDVIVEPDTVSKLVEGFERYPAADALTPVILKQREGDRPQEVGFYRGTLERELARHPHHLKDLPYEDREWPDAESPFVPFCATAFRSSLLKRVGYLDESLGTCWEDFDMCMRIAEAGSRIMTIGDARIVHFHGRTTGRVSPYITYYNTRNRLICWTRYNSTSSMLRHSPQVLRSLWWQMKAYGLDNWACHRSFARGVRDFALGRRGEDPEAARLRRDES